MRRTGSPNLRHPFHIYRSLGEIPVFTCRGTQGQNEENQGSDLFDIHNDCVIFLRGFWSSVRPRAVLFF